MGLGFPVLRYASYRLQNYFEILFGVPGRIRTCDLPLRRGSRYPAAPLRHLGSSLSFSCINYNFCYMLCSSNLEVSFFLRENHLLHAHIIRTTTTFWCLPDNVLLGIFYVACFAVDAVLCIDL